jgi:surfeit locus 1 family protein
MTLLIIIGALILCRLGIWQLDRLAQRRAFNTSLNTRMAQPALTLAGTAANPDALEYRRVEVRGVYDSAQEIVLRNRELDGTPGVHILTPLRISGSAAVLVDRGWIPRDYADQAARSAFAAPPGEQLVSGIARRSQEDAGGPQDPPFGPDHKRLDAWFHVNIARIEQQTGYPLLPIFIEQQPAPPSVGIPPGDPTLPRRVATADLGEGPHMGYAVQWFAFAIILVVGYIAFTYSQTRRVPDRP